MSNLDEIEFIKRVKQQTYKQASLIKGIGDDAAVLREQSNNIVIATDTFVEGVHFTKDTMSFYHVGYRLLAANLSDLAAMGAVPTYYLVSIVIPEQELRNSVTLIYDGMDALASIYKMDLIGGDTVTGKNLVLNVTVLGKVDEDKVRYRHTAKTGDIVFVTGTLGDSRAGLHVLMNDLDVIHQDYFIKRHRMPQPRVCFSQSLHKLNRLALNDVSDGIATEAFEIAKASNKSILLVDDQIPIHDSLYQFSRKQRDEWKYFGGEDFELIGTVAKEDWLFVKECAKQAKVQISKIGLVTELKEKYVYIQNQGKIRPLSRRGYTHLRQVE